ncbi:MAG: alanine racemase [Planctomycetota bacterium]|jgi:alanine racemase
MTDSHTENIPPNADYLVAQIDLAAITHNCKILRHLTPKNSLMCVAVKCNAYGHGVDIILPALKSANIDMLAVAAIPEAQQLRQLGWQKPILLLGSQFSIHTGKQKNELAEWLVANGVRITAMYTQDVEALAAAAKQLNKKALVHLMLDSGMGRMGLGEQWVLELIEAIKDRSEIEIEGLYTHLSTADDSDKTFSKYQLKRFDDFLAGLKTGGINIPIVHAANAAAVIDLPESHYNMIRPGIAVYGYQPGAQMLNKPDLKPSMKLISYLYAVKKIKKGGYAGYGNTWQAPEDTIVGLTPVGYGDGYDRRLSNKGKMKIAAVLAPVVGRVSMDQTILDLTPLVRRQIDVSPGMEVTVIDNDPNATNSIESIAAQLHTIPYEIVTKLGSRITRVPL